MAANPGLAGAAAGLSELRNRLLFVLMALLVYRTGTHIPVPGINPERLAALFDQQQGGILDLFNMFSGGALERMSILALGVVPYITSSIIMNLMSMMYPSLQQLRKEGESGRRKITQYTRYGTLAIALIQGTSLSVTLANQGLAFSTGFAFFFVATTTLVTGALFMMWLGEQITERGVGNGISLIIFSGIVSGFPSAIGRSFEAARQGDINIIALLAIAAFAIMLVAFIVYVERGQRRITVNYAKRQQGRRVYQGQSSHLPLKINMAGVIPAILALIHARFLSFTHVRLCPISSGVMRANFAALQAFCRFALSFLKAASCSRDIAAFLFLCLCASGVLESFFFPSSLGLVGRTAARGIAGRTNFFLKSVFGPFTAAPLSSLSAACWSSFLFLAKSTLVLHVLRRKRGTSVLPDGSSGWMPLPSTGRGLREAAQEFVVKSTNNDRVFLIQTK